ncbi:hypothetical protein BDP67DRAFT_262794 [Colletotrichum lupini]|nr:hypothetical protein BDP67DRAFT_262794 [Colletotrichum lupini]
MRKKEALSCSRSRLCACCHCQWRVEWTRWAPNCRTRYHRISPSTDGPIINRYCKPCWAEAWGPGEIETADKREDPWARYPHGLVQTLSAPPHNRTIREELGPRRKEVAQRAITGPEARLMREKGGTCGPWKLIALCFGTASSGRIVYGVEPSAGHDTECRDTAHRAAMQVPYLSPLLLFGVIKSLDKHQIGDVARLDCSDTLRKTDMPASSSTEVPKGMPCQIGSHSWGRTASAPYPWGLIVNMYPYIEMFCSME